MHSKSKCTETQFLHCSSVCVRVRIPFDCTLFCTINHSLTKTISKRMEKKEKKNRENFSNTSLDNIYTLYTRIHYTILSILLLAIRAALLVRAPYVVFILHFSQTNTTTGTREYKMKWNSLHTQTGALRMVSMGRAMATVAILVWWTSMRT